MGFMDDLSRAVYAEMPRKIELNRSMTIEELYALLEQHADEFPVPFKLSGFLGKRIIFARHPKLEMQLWVTVKDNVITVRPNSQEVTYETESFRIRTVDIKNADDGFFLGAELNRDDYTNAVTAKIESIVNG
ncbi:MAG: hypothetical protein IJG53_08370 [Eggerthellaceae bacterium]|nr:hypothetical protein [Eggerthellaceae bacterium]